MIKKVESPDLKAEVSDWEAREVKAFLEIGRASCRERVCVPV